MPGKLAEKIALVTGASKGIGRGIAEELARQGCHVAVNYHSDREGAEATAASLRDLGRRALAVGASVAVAAEVDAMFEKVIAEFSRIDILVSNAGMQIWKPFLEIEEAEWDRVIDTNLKGNFLCIQRAGRLMKQQGKGRIITIGSGSNKLPFPTLASYTASKGGLEMLTKVAAAELGPLGITVNCVAPGATEIERTKLEADDYAGSWGPLTPMRRIGRPADIASAVAYLASDEAGFITGQTLHVDGGLNNQGPWPYKKG